MSVVMSFCLLFHAKEDISALHVRKSGWWNSGNGFVNGMGVFAITAKAWLGIVRLIPF